MPSLPHLLVLCTVLLCLSPTECGRLDTQPKRRHSAKKDSHTPLLRVRSASKRSVRGWSSLAKVVNGLWPKLCRDEIGGAFMNDLMNATDTEDADSIYMYTNGFSPVGLVVGKVYKVPYKAFKIQAICSEPGYGRHIMNQHADRLAKRNFQAIELNALVQVISFYLKMEYHMGTLWQESQGDANGETSWNLSPCQPTQNPRVLGLEKKAAKTRIGNQEGDLHKLLLEDQEYHNQPWVQLLLTADGPREAHEFGSPAEVAPYKTQICKAIGTKPAHHNLFFFQVPYQQAVDLEGEWCDVWYNLNFGGGMPMHRCLDKASKVPVVTSKSLLVGNQKAFKKYDVVVVVEPITSATEDEELLEVDDVGTVLEVDDEGDASLEMRDGRQVWVLGGDFNKLAQA